MDTPTSAAPDEKTPPLELALATQLSKSATQEKSKTCSAKSTARWPELISSSKLLARGKASRAHKHFYPALAMSARGDRRPILSNAFEPGSNGRESSEQRARALTVKGE